MKIDEMESELATRGVKDEVVERCDPCTIPVRFPLALPPAGLTIHYPRRTAGGQNWRTVIVGNDETGKAEYKRMYDDGHLEDI